MRNKVLIMLIAFVATVFIATTSTAQCCKNGAGAKNQSCVGKGKTANVKQSDKAIINANSIVTTVASVCNCGTKCECSKGKACNCGASCTCEMCGKSDAKVKNASAAFSCPDKCGCTAGEACKCPHCGKDMIKSKPKKG
jgi:hypothetical protein